MKYLMVPVVILMIVLCASCELPDRMVTVVIDAVQPWEAASHKMMWYTLVWTSGDGQFQKIHMNAGSRSIKVPIPRGRTVVFCAYPLGELEPLGGAYVPLSTSQTVVLSQQEGRLCKMLQDISKTASEPVAMINYPQLVKLVGDIATADMNRLGKDILNGMLSNSSIQMQTPLEVILTNIPVGQWIPEKASNESFWFDYDVALPLVLPEGIHRFLNRESDLELRILVDGATNRSLIHIKEAHPFF